jgi:hypothetical protein
MKSGRPNDGEFHHLHASYVALVPEEDICAAAESAARDVAALLAGIDEENSKHRYAAEKWSIKQLVGHVADAERIFAYRALCIARGETQSLPGFDENEYMRQANFDERPFAELVADLNAARQSSIALLRGFGDEAWMREGVANKQRVTVRGVGYAMVGHARHHMNVLRERYLQSAT